MLAKETAASVPASVPKVALQRCVHADAALPDGCPDLHWRAGDNRLSQAPHHGPPCPRRGQNRRFRHPEPQRNSRSEEHTSELQPLMRISYAVFRLKKKISIP